MTVVRDDRVLPVVHVISDEQSLHRADFVAKAAALLRSGGGRVAIHLRGHTTGGGVLERVARALTPAREEGGWLVINDRVDVAGVAAADGLQLGRRSLPRDVVRRLAPACALGASVHDLEGAEAAIDADWLVLGTIYETPSHPGRRGAGLAHAARVAKAVDRPVVAIGGITPDRAQRLRAVGAAGVAVSSGIWGARDSLAALEEYLAAWERAA